MAVGEHLLAFSAQDGIGDRLYLRTYRHTPAPGRQAGGAEARQAPHPRRAPAGGRPWPFITIADPALSPDGSGDRLRGGRRRGAAGRLRGAGGPPVAGPPAHRRLLRQEGPEPGDRRGSCTPRTPPSTASSTSSSINPATGERTRLTTSPSEDRYPSPQPDGSVLYTSDAGGKPDLWELRDGRIRRLTDFSTGPPLPARRLGWPGHPGRHVPRGPVPAGAGEPHRPARRALAGGPAARRRAAAHPRGPAPRRVASLPGALGAQLAAGRGLRLRRRILRRDRRTGRRALLGHAPRPRALRGRLGAG